MTQRHSMPNRHTFRTMIRAIFTLLVFIAAYAATAQTTRYVSATGSGNGSSWANASNDLQLMINQSASGDQVWVAAGTYLPNRQATNLGAISVANRNNAFVLKSGVKLYGGFAGSETTIAQRNLKNPARASILSGDFNGNDTQALTNMVENAYHVVISAGAVGTAELNGFTIQGGGFIVGTDATGSITVNGQTVNRDLGGGIMVKGSNPVLSNIVVRNCRSNFGGGLYVEQPGATCSITNSTFINNLAQFGGGACNFNGTFVYVNTLAYSNRAFANSGDGYGGGYLNFNATVQYNNATVVNNQSNRGGGMNHFNMATVTTRNSILFGNTGTVVTSNQWEQQVRFDGTITVNLFNNLIQDWTGGATANLNATGITMNDLFANPAGNDFRLKAGSVAINAGNSSFLVGTSTDIEGRPRVLGTNADLGAFERSNLKKWDRGAETNNWSDAANWVPDGLPIATDSVVLDHDYINGNYSVNLHNVATSVRSLNIDPTDGTSTILLNIPVANTVADNLRLTGAGFNALRIGEHGRITNAHGGTASTTRSIGIDGIASHGMLLDVGGYYHHHTRTSDINVLLNLDAREGSTFEFENPGGASFGFMDFPVSPAGNPFVEITELRFHHLIFSGWGHAATLANDWNLYVNGDITVRNNATLGLVRGGAQDARTMYLRGNINVVNTTATTWMDSGGAPVALGWNVVFDGSTQQQVNGSVGLLDRTTINNPAGVVVNNGRLTIKTGPVLPSVNPGLTLQNGIITTTGTGVVHVTLTDPSRLTGYSETRYINGRLERDVLGTGIYDFPVGTATDYQLATLSLTGITGVASIVSEFRTSELGTVATPIYEQPCRVYSGLLNAGFLRLTPNANPTGGTFGVTLNERGYSGVGAPYHTVVRRDNGSAAWGLQGLLGSDSEAAGTVSASRSGLTGFTDFAIAYPLTPLVPPTATVGGGGAACSTDPMPDVTFTFTGTAPWTFTYSGPGGQSVSNHPTNSYTISNAAIGTYSITALSDAHCTGTDFGTPVSVSTQPAPNAGTNGTLSICINAADADLLNALNGTPQAGGSWTFDGNQHSGTLIPGTDPEGMYTYTVIGVPPCASEAATVTVAYDNTDTDGDGIIDCIDNCPAVPGQIGSNCDANPLPNQFQFGSVNSSCLCVPVATTENLVLVVEADNNPTQISYEITDPSNNDLVLCSGVVDPAAANQFDTFECKLIGGCYRLRLFDSGGDGIALGNQGGYVLRYTGTVQLLSARDSLRVIDNARNFLSGGVSSIGSGPDRFCLPLTGGPKPLYHLRDKVDFESGKYLVCEENAAVSAQWSGGNLSSTGYEFWLFDPNGGYSYRRFRNHATSDGFSNVGATRACHMKINGWFASQHAPANKLLNVRIRTRVNGVNGLWGPAYRFKIDPVRAQCPLTMLNDFPGNQFESCNQTRTWGGNNSNLIHARPVSGANRYQWRFRTVGEPQAPVIIRTSNNYFLALNWTTDPLVVGKTYTVDVRASKNGGATWCIDAPPPVLDQWGTICTLTISGNQAQGGGQNLALESHNAELNLYPNPNRGDQVWLSIDGIDPGVGTIDVDLFDLLGHRVVAHTVPVHGARLQLELNGLATGVYIVHIKAGEKLYTERMVIER